MIEYVYLATILSTTVDIHSTNKLILNANKILTKKYRVTDDMLGFSVDDDILYKFQKKVLYFPKTQLIVFFTNLLC